ncbi:MAG: flagellar protein FlgN [Calditrichaeota bacterium]|nr:flagellar protein FlgN [Calditrichota bacterium]
MKDLIDRLIALIREEEHVLEEFLDCLNRQREAIIQNQMDAFDTSVREQESLIGRIRQLEDGRIKVVKEVAAAAGTEDDITITRLIELNLGESSDDLKSLKTVLSRLVEKVRKANRVNQYLIKRSLSFIERNIDLFIDEGDTAMVYQPNGARRSRGTPHLILDRRL